MKSTGRFGEFGGVFVPEILVPALEELEAAFFDAQNDVSFQAELGDLLRDYAGRPTPLYRCRNLCADTKARIYLKREDLLHGGAHKTNQVLGQGLLAKRLGKTRLIAETGAGQHGVATALTGALLGFETRVYMGEKDVKRQQLNVFRMQLMGAEVISVKSGSRSLKDAINEALRDWVTNVEDTFYIIGTVAGPHPFPAMVRDFQSIIGEEVREQIMAAENRLPDTLVACIGGGSNAMGLFHPFLDDADIDIIAVEAAGRGIETGEHAASLSAGSAGVLHGNRTYLLQDDDGQITEAHSISAGLDYPGIGPEHSWLHDIGRASYVSITDDEALDAFRLTTRLEGIIPALESAHAIAHVMKIAPDLPKDHVIVLNLSGRGDKDLNTVAMASGESFGVE